jgi:hypothetical protein
MQVPLLHRTELKVAVCTRCSCVHKQHVSCSTCTLSMQSLRERAGADVRVSVRVHGVPALLQTAALLTLLPALLHWAQ